jgi:hypothetical protein
MCSMVGSGYKLNYVCSLKGFIVPEVSTSNNWDGLEAPADNSRLSIPLCWILFVAGDQYLFSLLCTTVFLPRA